MMPLTAEAVPFAAALVTSAVLFAAVWAAWAVLLEVFAAANADFCAADDACVAFTAALPVRSAFLMERDAVLIVPFLTLATTFPVDLVVCRTLTPLFCADLIVAVSQLRVFTCGQISVSEGRGLEPDKDGCV